MVTNARRARRRARRVAVRRIPGLRVGVFLRCRCTRLRLPLVGAASQAEGLQDPICNALSVRSEVTRSPERKQVHHAHECMLLVYGGEVYGGEVGLLVPAHPNGRWKGSARLQRKKGPFVQHERHLLGATWFTKFRAPSMNYIPRHRAMTWNIIHRGGSKLCKPRVI